MRFTIFQDSRQGDRDGNEDRVGYSYSRDVLLLTVADGMGGHEKGEVAAEIAVGEITRRFQHEARNRLRKPADFLVSAIQSAHRAIVSHAVEHNLLECPRTTCVACIVQGGSDNLSVVAMTWENQDDARIADTQSMDEEEFESSANTTELLGGEIPEEDVTDADIERAISEIQDAIRKVPR